MRIASALGLHQVVVNTYIGFTLIHHWASENLPVEDPSKTFHPQKTEAYITDQIVKIQH